MASMPRMIEPLALNGNTVLQTNGFANELSGSSARDVNGDGFDDLLGATLNIAPNESGSGARHVEYAHATEASVTFKLLSLYGTNGLHSKRAEAAAGFSHRASSNKDDNGAAAHEFPAVS